MVDVFLRFVAAVCVIIVGIEIAIVVMFVIIDFKSRRYGYDHLYDDSPVERDDPG